MSVPEAEAKTKPGNNPAPGMDPDPKEIVRLLAMVMPESEFDRLHKIDKDFVIDMRDKMKMYGKNAQFTWRQVYRLRSIKDRLLESPGQLPTPTAAIQK
jgi:hypothetical protein